MKIRTYLPDVLNVKGVRFIRITPLGVDIKRQIQLARSLRIRYRVVSVLGRYLRGRTDLHGKPYKPHQYLMVTHPDEMNHAMYY